MKIYISCDAEGVAGIADWEQCLREKYDYKLGRELMTREVNAAIDGALAAGATEIVVNDSHERMINILPEELHPQAQLLQGRIKPMSMVEGLDGSYDAALFIGYHSMAGTPGGMLSHTFSSIITEVRINDTAVGEPELNGLMAGWYGVPLVFLSGDDAVTKEIKKFIPNIITVVTKKGRGKRVGLTIHPEEARRKIRHGVESALRHYKEIKPLRPKKPVTLQLDFWLVEMADLVAVIPGVKRKSSRTLEFKSNNYVDIYGMFLTFLRVALLARE